MKRVDFQIMVMEILEDNDVMISAMCVRLDQIWKLLDGKKAFDRERKKQASKKEGKNV